MMSSAWTADRNDASRVYTSVTRRFAALLFCAVLAACGGGNKKGNTTPTGDSASSGGSDPQSMTDTPDPGYDGAGGDVSGGTTPGGSQGGSQSGSGGQGGSDGQGGSEGEGGSEPVAEVPIVFPNLDPDPAQARAQVEQHLNVARQALSRTPPDADGALAAAKQALAVDASSVDAAAYVAFAYYHKKHYDTSELVLDELFKRSAAKQNANVYYVYGLIYDQTNRPEQAVAAYRKAVEINPSFASALINLGVHQLRNKQYGQAQATFERLTKQLGREDAITLTSLGSAYRGRSADYPVGSSERMQFILGAETAYKRALQVNPNYGPAYYNLALLFLDADPYPARGGTTMDTLERLNTAKNYLDQYKNMPGVDIKLYDERMKDVTRAIKREEKRRKASN